MNRPPWTTRNLPYDTGGLGGRQRHARCGHCSNSGMVRLDTEVNRGAPCPMCEQGKALDGGLFQYLYWHGVDLATATWEGGLTVDHLTLCRVKWDTSSFDAGWKQREAMQDFLHPCGRPSRGSICEQHTAIGSTSAALQSPPGTWKTRMQEWGLAFADLKMSTVPDVPEHELVAQGQQRVGVKDRGAALVEMRADTTVGNVPVYAGDLV